MTPGPTRIPERVLLASHRVLHHRTPEFSDVLDETFDLIRPFFGAASADVLPVHATGRAAMEGAITNFFAPGDAVVACCNGSFGEMWAEFAESYGLDVRRVCEDWEHSVDPAVVEAALAGGGVRGCPVHAFGHQHRCIEPHRSDRCGRSKPRIADPGRWHQFRWGRALLLRCMGSRLRGHIIPEMFDGEPWALVCGRRRACLAGRGAIPIPEELPVIWGHPLDLGAGSC